MDKKLLAIYTNKKVNCILAGFIKGKLVIANFKAVDTGNINSLTEVSKDIKDKKSKSYHIAIDEPYKQLSEGLLINSLKQKNGKGEPNLVNALNAYNYLEARKAIVFKQGVKRISVPDSIVDHEVTADGKDRYVVDWESIKEESLALLLLCNLCVNNSPTELTYLQSVFSEVRTRNITRPSPLTVRGFAT